MYKSNKIYIPKNRTVLNSNIKIYKNRQSYPLPVIHLLHNFSLHNFRPIYFAYNIPTILLRSAHGKILHKKLKNLYCMPAVQIGLQFFLFAIFAIY